MAAGIRRVELDDLTAPIPDDDLLPLDKAPI
jgi:hypothetical protein